MRRSSAPLRRSLIAQVGSTQSASTLQQVLINDMTLPHEGPLDGVPSFFDWSAGPRIGYGNRRGPDDTWTAATAWGQVYSSNNPSTNTLVQVRNLKLYLLSGGVWSVLQHTKTSGATGVDAGFYKSDYANNTVAPAIPKTYADGTRAGRPNVQWNMHFFPQGRATVGAGIQAIAVSFDARLTLDNPAGTDDRASAKFLAGAGADFWQDTSVDWVQGFLTNGDAAIARMRWVTNDWQTFTMTTATPGQIQSNPPPITLAGTGGSTPGGSVGGGGGTPAPTAWERPTGRAIRIMPLGDSITAFQGTDPTGWVTMPERFAAAGFEVISVGNEVGWGGVKHEGHGAWCADDNGNRCTHSSGYHAGGLIQSVTPWLAAHTPDIVLLNIGTNDRYVTSGYSDTQVRDAVSTLLDIITAARPTAMVYLTRLRYSDELGGWSSNANLNSLFAALVTQKQAAGKLVRIYDAYATVNQASDFRDYLHPSAQGVGKMMDATYAEMLSLFQGAAPVTKPDLDGPTGDPEYPALDTLVQSFPGSSLDGEVWEMESGTVAVTSNEARLAASGAEMALKGLYSLRDSSVRFKVDPTAHVGFSFQSSYVQVRSNGSAGTMVTLGTSKGSSTWEVVVEGLDVGFESKGSGSFDYTTDKFFRIRHSTSANRIYVEKSTVGINGAWTALCDFATPPTLNVDTCDLLFGCQGGGTGYVAISKVNAAS